jgi:hypothetical protein
MPSWLTELITYFQTLFVDFPGLGPAILAFIESLITMVNAQQGQQTSTDLGEMTPQEIRLVLIGFRTEMQARIKAAADGYIPEADKPAAEWKKPEPAPAP